MHNARWNTKFARILNLYIRTENPSDELIMMVKFITQVYAPVLFNIVMYPHAANGANHVFEYIRLSKICLPDQEFQLVFKYIMINSYFLHPENILLSGENNTFSLS